MPRELVILTRSEGGLPHEDVAKRLVGVERGVPQLERRVPGDEEAAQLVGHEAVAAAVGVALAEGGAHRAGEVGAAAAQLRLRIYF